MFHWKKKNFKRHFEDQVVFTKPFSLNDENLSRIWILNAVTILRKKISNEWQQTFSRVPNNIGFACVYNLTRNQNNLAKAVFFRYVSSVNYENTPINSSNWILIFIQEQNNIWIRSEIVQLHFGRNVMK